MLLGNMNYVNASCGNGVYSCTAGLTYGFHWTDVIPTGSIISSVSIQFQVGVECAAGAHIWQMNSVNQGSYTDLTNGCSCVTISNSVATLAASPANYIIGGTNNFRITVGASCLGFNINGLGTGIYAKVTVTYSSGSPPTISSFTPTSGCPGTSVAITGTNFTGTTAVKFGGTNAASFVVNSSTSITDRKSVV